MPDIIRDYYRERYGKPSAVITYGAPILERDPPPDLEQYGLVGVEPNGYILYVSRLEPENQADMVIRAYRDVPGDLPLLIIGDAPYAAVTRRTFRRSRRGTHASACPVAIYGQGYRDLQRGALAYVQATSVGGTHPALIESMGAGNLILAYGTPENAEVTAGTGLLFKDERELTDQLTRLVGDPADGQWANLRRKARMRARSVYSWDAVTDAYERLFRGLRREGTSSRPA